ncbi:MAG TPA: hypothetical protein VM867_04670, partial [Xanthobacteraceae bacterium]|nr:hypothetical protein [Xanthobacteraceae bacterium]
MTYLGVVMAAFVVAGTLYLVKKDYDDDHAAAVRSGQNLARVFEGYISRSVKSVDSSIKFLRNSYLKSNGVFDIEAWSREFEFK